MESLFSLVRRNEVETMLENARLARDWPDVEERRTEAERQIRALMYRSALGQIDDEERDRILAVLAPCCPYLFLAAIPMREEVSQSPPVE